MAVTAKRNGGSQATDTSANDHDLPLSHATIFMVARSVRNGVAALGRVSALYEMRGAVRPP